MAITVPADYTYLDWAATSPLCREAADAMAPYLAPGQANIPVGMNANSLHAPGRAAFEAMELARRQLAEDIGASRPAEVVFTSGATEADNMALLGISRAQAALRRKADAGFKPRVVTTEIEHDAVLKPASQLAREGFDVVLLKPDRAGFVSCEALEQALDGSVVLVSVQAANSEVGSVQPIARLAEAAHRAGALFHCDATQVLGKTAFDVGELGVDAASFSAHKAGGPKGVGALYLKARTPIEPLLVGGGQEDGRRSTTQNVCGIVGFAAAVRAACGRFPEESARQRGLRDGLYRRLVALDGVKAAVEVETGSTDYLPNIVNVLVEGMESETLVLRLDRAGFGVSGGSACSSHSLKPSHVLRALGISADEAYGALRISFGHLTVEEDLSRFADALASMLADAR